MTQRERIEDRRIELRRASRGDGSALATFLCPVCLHDALTADVGCDHLLLIRDRFGEIYCRDPQIRGFCRVAEEEVGERGVRAIERLCEQLGPSVILYELLDDSRAPPTGTSTLFVVDVGDHIGATMPRPGIPPAAGRSAP